MNLEFHDCFYRLSGGGFWDELKADKPCVSGFLQAGEYIGVVDLSGAAFMAAGDVRHVDVAELVSIGPNIPFSAKQNFRKSYIYWKILDILSGFAGKRGFVASCLIMEPSF